MAKGKIVFDFDTAKSCEVWNEKLQDWFRVTPYEFRSFGGKRRILQFEKSKNKREFGKPYYEDYEGPVYIYGTNEVIRPKKADFIYENDEDPRIFKVRPWEGHLVEKVTNEQGSVDQKFIRTSPFKPTKNGYFEEEPNPEDDSINLQHVTS